MWCCWPIRVRRMSPYWFEKFRLARLIYKGTELTFGMIVNGSRRSRHALTGFPMLTR